MLADRACERQPIAADAAPNASHGLSPKVVLSQLLSDRCWFQPSAGCLSMFAEILPQLPPYFAGVL